MDALVLGSWTGFLSGFNGFWIGAFILRRPTVKLRLSLGVASRCRWFQKQFATGEINSIQATELHLPTITNHWSGSCYRTKEGLLEKMLYLQLVHGDKRCNS